VAYRAAVSEAQEMRGGFGYPEPFDSLSGRLRAVRKARRVI
jgi:hypothetical protein